MKGKKKLLMAKCRFAGGLGCALYRLVFPAEAKHEGVAVRKRMSAIQERDACGAALAQRREPK